jgi:cell division protein FtsI/penicillin-binding protein 2
MSASAARSLRAAMLEVTQVGTAHGVFRTLPFSVAGKTGTAENNQGDGQPHSWFVGFAPADRPEVAFAVIVENGGLGAKVAAPAARDILRAWWERRGSR